MRPPWGVEAKKRDRVSSRGKARRIFQFMRRRVFELRFGRGKRFLEKRIGFLPGAFEEAEPAPDRLFGRLEKPARRSDAARSRECRRAVGIRPARESLFRGIVSGIAGRPAGRAVRNPVLQCRGSRRCWKPRRAVPAPAPPSMRPNKARWRREARTSHFAKVRRRRQRTSRKGALGRPVCIGESSGGARRQRRGILIIEASVPKRRIGFSFARLRANGERLRPRGPIFSNRRGCQPR